MHRSLFDCPDLTARRGVVRVAFAMFGDRYVSELGLLFSRFCPLSSTIYGEEVALYGISPEFDLIEPKTAAPRYMCEITQTNAGGVVLLTLRFIRDRQERASHA